MMPGLKCDAQPHSENALELQAPDWKDGSPCPGRPGSARRPLPGLTKEMGRSATGVAGAGTI